MGCDLCVDCGKGTLADEYVTLSIISVVNFKLLSGLLVSIAIDHDFETYRINGKRQFRIVPSR